MGFVEEELEMCNLCREKIGTNTTTQKQGIEIAAQFMGRTWHKNTTCDCIRYYDNRGKDGCIYGWHSCCSEHEYDKKKEGQIFNPYKDENHFRMLLEKIMEDDKLFKTILMEMRGENVASRFYNWITATLQERMDAFLSVYSKTQ